MKTILCYLSWVRMSAAGQCWGCLTGMDTVVSKAHEGCSSYAGPKATGRISSWKLLLCWSLCSWCTSSSFYSRRWIRLWLSHHLIKFTPFWLCLHSQLSQGVQGMVPQMLWGEEQGPGVCTNPALPWLWPFSIALITAINTVGSTASFAMNVISFIEKKRCEFCPGNTRAVEGMQLESHPFSASSHCSRV